MVAKPKLEDTPRFDRYVAAYIKLRKQIESLNDQYKKFIVPKLEQKEQLAGLMLEMLDQSGQTSAKTAEGTVYITNPPYASVPDPDAFMDFVTETGAFELMDRKANAKACIEYAEEHGSLPPGVKINIKRSVGVRS